MGGDMETVTDWGDAIFLAITNAINTFLAAIPQIIGALLILIIGWIIAGIVARILQEILARAGVDRVFAEHGRPVYGDRTSDLRPSIVAAEIVKWIIRFVFLVAAANVLGMTQVSVLLNQVLLWLPNLLVAAVILLVAPLLGRFVRGLIEVGAGQMGFTNARVLGRLAEVAIIAFAVLIAINQIGVAADLINILFIGIVAALAIAVGLAFGLGGRDVAAEITRGWYTDLQGAAAKVQASTAAAATATEARGSGGTRPMSTSPMASSPTTVTTSDAAPIDRRGESALGPSR
jgi:hypothetical protein